MISFVTTEARPWRKWSAAPSRELSVGQKDSRRRALRARDGDDCFYCLEPLGEDASLEHLLERAQGGGHDLENLVLAHRVCNERVCGWSVHKKLVLRGDVLLRRLEREREVEAASNRAMISVLLFVGAHAVGICWHWLLR